MARTVNDRETREGFAHRFEEELDRVGFQRKGRASALAREFGVSHTTPGAWLAGSMPALGVLVRICEKLRLDFTYLCTGERAVGSAGVDPDIFRDAVSRVNEIVKENGWFDDVGLDRIGSLYMRAYLSIEAGEEGSIEGDVRLAAGR